MLRRIVIAAVAVCALGTVHIQAQKMSSSVPKKFGTTRKATPSTLMEAVSLYHKGMYYWYGEYKVGKTVLPL